MKPKRPRQQFAPTPEQIEHTQAEADYLAECLPDAAKHAKIRGCWIWVEFDSKPDEATRNGLRRLGYHWNKKREAWQNPCGNKSRQARGYDPRDKYQGVSIETVTTEA